MAITDGMRTHDEGSVKRYRMPDLLTLEEMKMYFAGTYNVGIELVDLSDEMREKATGVGTLPYQYEPSPADTDKMLLRKQLGLDSKDDLKELHGRVLTRPEFEEKYGPQPDVAPPKDAAEGEAVGEGNSDDVSGPLPAVETEEERQSNVVVPEQTDEQRQAEAEQAPRQDPGGELARLLRDQK